MRGEAVVELNGFEVWAFAVEVAGGLRLRLSLDDWRELDLVPGRCVTVRLPDEPDQWLVVTQATEVPPLVWVQLARRVRLAG